MTKEEREESEEAADESERLSDLAEELNEPVPEEDEEGQALGPSPEEAENLRRTMARLQATMNPRIGYKFHDLLGKSSLLRNYGNLAKFGRFNLPEGTMRNFSAISRLPKDVGKVGRINLPESALKGVLGQRFSSGALANFIPALSLEPGWMKQFKLINSDVYKVAGLGQSNLTKLNSVLAKNTVFSFDTSAAKLASQFASQQASWLKTVGPLLEKLKTGFYPANLKDIEDLAFEQVETVVMLDGISLYGVPRTEIAEKLIRAETAQARREILGRRWKSISADCRAAVEGCSSASVADYVTFAVAALDALDNEHTEAAQALAASLLDTLVNGYFGTDRYMYTPDMKGKRTTAEYENFTVREFIAFAPLWQAYQKFKTEDGDSIPHTFSRHASVHGVSTRQFSRRNAVQALLFVTGLLVFLDEEASALEAA